ncbi:fimbrial protein [Ignatzschineria sp. LJL83]
MKKTLLAASVFALAMGSASFAQTQSVGTIEFTGDVTNAACTIDQANTNVDLGSVSTKRLAAAGNTGPWGTAHITFSDCNLGLEADDPTAAKSIELSIGAGQAATNGPNLWANTYGLDSQNVGVEVQIGGQAVTPAGLGGDNVIVTSLGNGTNSTQFDVRGRMVATGEATEGSVGTLLNFVAVYR